MHEGSTICGFTIFIESQMLIHVDEDHVPRLP